MTQDVYRWPHRVTYAECTLGDHVFHSRYLDILDRARGEFLRHIGQPLLALQNANVIFPITECRLRYKAAARYDDEILVEVRPAELERVRMAFDFRILHRDGGLLLEARIVYACTNVEGKLQRIPEDFAATLRPFLPL